MTSDRARVVPATTVLLDCRWLGLGGAGRVTELLLADLRSHEPWGAWKLWGRPDLLAPYVFPGASVVPWHGFAPRWFGQADLLRVPSSDVAVYLHQVRPLRPGRSVTIVHDTIPLRHGGRREARWAKGLFLRLACALSSRIVTVSAGSRDAIVRDLGVTSTRIAVASLGVDATRIERIRALRASASPDDVVAYVGRFAEHKNLRRLARAFQATDFHRTGGRLLLVGGTDDEAAAMTVWLREERLRGVEVRGWCRDPELDLILASCRAVVQPSLEEGYGLPAVEAAAIGIPVAASATGIATEIPADRLTLLDPLDEGSIARAVDAAAAAPIPATPWTPGSTIGDVVLRAVVELAGTR